MTADELGELLRRRAVIFTDKAVQNGRRFECKTGEIFNVFDSGKMSFQGKQGTPLAQEVNAIYDGTIDDKPVEPPGHQTVTGSPRIFVVYGHDTAARDQLELTLRRMGFEPVIQANLAAAGDTVIEKLERYIGEHGNVGLPVCC
jgi:predicted nucleotide-binding protein